MSGKKMKRIKKAAAGIAILKANKGQPGDPQKEYDRLKSIYKSSSHNDKPIK